MATSNRSGSGQEQRPRRRSLKTPTAIAVLTALATAWGGTSAYESYQFRNELDQAKRAAAAGEFESARKWLEGLSARWPEEGEVEAMLGGVEAQLGHVSEALEAWKRVPSNSEFAGDAAIDRAKVALQHGRLSIVEESLAKLDGVISSTTSSRKEEAAKLADQLDLYLGDTSAIARRLERGWKSKPQGEQAETLRTHWLLDSQPFPIESVRDALDKMAIESPDDPRLLLARANLDIKLERNSEADALLKRCESQGPDDPKVAESRFRWALAAGALRAAMEVASKLPADHFESAKVIEFALIAARLQNQVETERKLLLERVELEPGDAPSWERLAEIAVELGPLEDEALAHQRKAEIDRDKQRYRTAMGKLAAKGDEPVDFVDLAKTAERLGRWFEAQGWWSLRARQTGINDLDRNQARQAANRLALQTATLGKAKGASATTLDERINALIAGNGRKVSTTTVKAPAAPPLAVPAFEEIAAKSGLDFTYDHDPTPALRLPETIGGGIGLIDFDADGFLDVYVVQGKRLDSGSERPSPPNLDKLFRNLGNGRFEDVTERSGLTKFPGGYGHGVTVGDYDNDGFPDLFVTRWRSYALYRNRGDGTFEDATERAGLGGPRGWPTSSAFGDLDNDGDLDLYVCHYFEYDLAHPLRCSDPDRPERNVYCVPRAFKAEPDRLYRNDGGVFKEVSKESGITDADLDGRGLGVVIADLDADGLPDIYIANDMSANFFFHNKGNLQFEEIASASGAASNGNGGFQAGMGVACGDLDGDGLPELAVTNFHGESTTLFQNLGRGLFADRTTSYGLAASSRSLLGFGAAFFDANNDGKLDLATANGHVNDYRPAIPYAMPAQLYLNDGQGRFNDVSKQAGPCWESLRLGRGLAIGDLDNDQRLDLLILSQGTPLAYFHNLGTDRKSPRNQALTLKLTGTVSNRDATGTKLLVKANNRTQTLEKFGGGSFLSTSDPRIHIGIGAASTADLEIHWPSGKVETFNHLEAGSALEIKEGDPNPKPLKGWSEH